MFPIQIPLAPLDLSELPEEVRTQATEREWQPHTKTKLEILAQYLNQFVKACLSAAGPGRKICFVDAFAGTGLVRIGQKVYPGSPLLALAARHVSKSSKSGQEEKHVFFTDCHFVELHRKKFTVLGEVIRTLAPEDLPRCTFHQGDSNDIIATVLSSFPPAAPCFVLLDQQSTELKWTTVCRIAAHKYKGKPKPELLILFPVDMSIFRVWDFTKGVSETEAEKLQIALGTDQWKDIYELRRAEKITAVEARQRLVAMYCQNIRALGYQYVRHRRIDSARGKPLYYLVYATNHPAGDRIMDHVFRTYTNAQRNLFSKIDLQLRRHYKSKDR